jgi:hypothetical protein
MLTGLIGLVFAAIEVLLLVRLALPFIQLPAAINEWIPKLLWVTDQLLAPFSGFFQPFNLAGAIQLTATTSATYGLYQNRWDVALLMAMAVYGAIAFLIWLVLSMLGRFR